MGERKRDTLWTLHPLKRGRYADRSVPFFATLRTKLKKSLPFPLGNAKKEAIMMVFNIYELTSEISKHVAQQPEASADVRPTWPSPEMKMSKVGNQTNSQDPQAVNSRAFVGNLNTFQCSKTDVERMFQRYGRIAGECQHQFLQRIHCLC
ncbi:hypothetical protein J437_LFUL018796 [Ladona fulva]|uniref:Uncharacterized protein n=1 Tax=Ladona fulva TaxID=123851 RepID=A0A8K0KVG1_LADFU|nr:hypothetical protein J437_LFUL018796 [Ladona fulva]